MPRRVIWFLPGSSAAALVRALPAAFEARPLSPYGPSGDHADEGAVLLLDLEGQPAEHAADLARLAGDVPIVGLVDASTGTPPASCYAYVAKPVAPFVLAKAVESACEHARLAREAAEARRQLEELNTIGARLTAERDTDTLLELILTKAREITRSDAGSLYLVEEPDTGPRRLRFKLAQNDSMIVPFLEHTLPIGEDSVAGYVALSGETICLDDAYVLPEGAPFRINRDFDERVNYRTKSMLVVPMRTPAGETTGVLQLINCKRGRGRPLASPATAVDVLPYPPRCRDLAASLASQAAVALENSRLYQSIRTLFEGFVRASVTAIESRDPATSGHSFRVADFTVALATAVDRIEHGPFRDRRFSVAEMREIRYASLLHDFGKVGVREEVLVKAKKLQPWHLEQIHLRAEILRRGLELRYARRKLERLARHGHEGFDEVSAEWDAELRMLTQEIHTHLKTIAAANEPAVTRDEGVFPDLASLARRTFVDHLGEAHSLITPAEARILSIPRGSLTPEEYREIQSHVAHTYQFLSHIPWTRELRLVPEIARSHHEKLNGSGYPGGRLGGEIPIQARMMTICDIFDALTAGDRPYKATMTPERALGILSLERSAGAIDPALLDLFTDVKPWESRSA